MDVSRRRVARWRLRLSELRCKVCTRPARLPHCSDAMSRLPKLAPHRFVSPEEILCLALAESSLGSVALHCEQPDKEQPVTLARMLVAQNDDQQCQTYRIRWTNGSTCASRSPKRDSSRVPATWTVQPTCASDLRSVGTFSGWSMKSCTPVILASTGCTPPFGASKTGSPWPRMCTNGWTAVHL